jgi:uncharacterized protein involved in exopolysaccharide biosynthesis
MEVNMDQNNQDDEVTEIDLNQYIKVAVKRKNTFNAVFLLILTIGIALALLSPKKYRTSMMIQPPVAGQSLTGANDLESAENLKGLIVNGVFNEELRKRLNLDFDKDDLEFKVVIPSKTNILQVSIDLESKKKEIGVSLLRNLSDLISSSYAKSIEAKMNDSDSQIELNERAIVNAKEKAKSLQDEIKEVTIRETKLKEEIAAINLNSTQILNKREGLLKNNTTPDNASILLLTNFLQNNLSYSNQLNNQFSDLSIRRVNLSLELKNIDSQISDFQAVVDKLKIGKNFIVNLKVIAQPRVSCKPISSSKMKIFVLSIVMGLFFGLLAVFLQESWVNSLVKK